METTSPIITPLTATEILGEVLQPIEPTFAPQFAQAVLGLRLSDVAQERVRDFIQRNNAGTLSAAEKAVLENYLLVGQFLDLLQAKARLCLKNGAASP
jgi:hypothetical protein